MRIINNYSGANITKIKYKENSNEYELTLSSENKGCSHYFNFLVDNLNGEKGKIKILNFKNDPYYRSDKKMLIYSRENDNWKILKNYNFINDELIIEVEANKKMEISSAPRYTSENFYNFIKANNLEKYISKSDSMTSLFIGDKSNATIFFIARQHPGETLSSFFLEEVIKSILKDKELLDKFSFYIVPFVNIRGVENGNHRYYNEIDYNRSWKNAKIKEIEYIKQQLQLYNIIYFIDVHNDEISMKDYIKYYAKKGENIQLKSMISIKEPHKIRRWIRALIKQKKIINILKSTATEYVYKKYHCTAIVVELSMLKKRKNNEISFLGKNFLTELQGGNDNEECIDSCKKKGTIKQL